MRNHYEHFDERIEKWERQSKRHNYADLNIGPQSEFDFVDELDQFRMFDPETTELRFWGQAFNIQDLVNEVQAILPKLEEEANRPHHAN